MCFITAQSYHLVFSSKKHVQYLSLQSKSKKREVHADVKIRLTLTCCVHLHTDIVLNLHVR